MSCGNCGKNGSVPRGCNQNGGCTSGGCNRLNTFDWLADTGLDDFGSYDIVEVSFKHGSHKDFYRIDPSMHVDSGSMVVVDTGSGSNVGRVNLTGQLVALQMKKKKVHRDRIMNKVLRLAGERDLQRMEEARKLEHDTMVRARAIVRMLNLEMKIGDVEYQADKRKATFYFTANGRVDFRELIRHYAREFRVKVEMRQIGSRQESARIGGLGSCGRELCCSSWLTTFKSVSTKAARYQNLAINQSKLSGQCGRLKCCLNYELDLYTETLDRFPMSAETLKTKMGTGHLLKVDIFKKEMYYSIKSETGKLTFASLPVDRVWFLYRENQKGRFPATFLDPEKVLEEVSIDFADVTGGVELKEMPKRRKKRRGRNRRKKGSSRRSSRKKK